MSQVWDSSGECVVLEFSGLRDEVYRSVDVDRWVGREGDRQHVVDMVQEGGICVASCYGA